MNKTLFYFKSQKNLILKELEQMNEHQLIGIQITCKGIPIFIITKYIYLKLQKKSSYLVYLNVIHLRYILQH